MHDGSRNIGTLLVVAAVVWHVLSVLTPAWTITFDNEQGRDFASYYYAVKVAADGGDPYDKAQLGQAARSEATRRGVHPFLYAPPFLLGMAWALPYDLPTAFHAWFWLHELMAVAAAIVLIVWWRPLGRDIPALVALIVALMTAIPNNHAMGQANFPGLLLALAGLWQTDRGRPALGGALMGAACMLKMSPALFVAWWLLRREGTAVIAAIGAAVALSIATIPLLGVHDQLRFYTEILPTFSTGWYNGLAVPIELFGNHSIPNLVHPLLSGGGRTLSPTAQGVSTGITVALLAGLAWAWRHPDPQPLQRAAQAAGVGVLLLLVPVYTYEHHLVFAIPAAVIGVHAVLRGLLDERWAVPVALAVAVLLFDLQVIKGIPENLPTGMGWLGALLRELKFGGLVVLLASSARLGSVRAGA